MTKIFFDVDTQNDFMNKDGLLYVPGAEDIKPNLKKLADYAIEHDIPIFGSSDCHHGTKYFKDVELELKMWGGPFQNHCMDGSKGAERIEETKNSLTEEFKKQTYDVFDNNELREKLQKYNVTEAVVYGVATDYCIKAAVTGLQNIGIQCFVVEDAISGVSEETTKDAKAEMIIAGAKFIKTSDILK